MKHLDEIRAQLEQYGQSHLLHHWKVLDDVERSLLLKQLREVDFELMKQLYASRNNGSKNSSPDQLLPLAYTKLEEQTHDDYAVWRERGYAQLREGKVAALLVAGGQGTRLGITVPKGTTEIGLPSGSSLFELQALQLLHLQKVHNASVTWLIMTSQINDRETRDFFEEHNYFELNREDLFFFSQGQLPALDESGQLLMATPGTLARVPDGNGGVFRALKSSGGLDWLKSRGCTTTFLYGVDNALVRVCEPTLIGFHISRHRPVSCPVVSKAHPEERVGIFVEHNGNSCVAEYTDITDEMRFARDSRGNLVFDGSNMAIHILDIEVLEEAAAQSLPYHAAFKPVSYYNTEGKIVDSEKPNSWKFEQFMFDIFPRFGAMAALEVLRKEHFAPVKNSWGEDSPESARLLTLELHTRWLKQAGLLPADDSRLFEVSRLQSLSGGHLYNRTLEELLEKKLIFLAC